MAVTVSGSSSSPTTWRQFSLDLNSKWHERALYVFMAIVLAHWAEHVVQVFQIFVLGWARPDSRGVLGLYFPWLVKSEVLHYVYAIVMLVGLWILRSGFTGRSYVLWMVAFWIQFWHHIEHALLQGQAIFERNLWGSAVPTSVLQWVLWRLGEQPHQFRVELHFFYNAIVFIPMLAAMWYHMFPPKGEAESHPAACTCRRSAA